MLFYEKKHYIYITPVFSPELAKTELLFINGFRWCIGLLGAAFALTVIKLVLRVFVREHHTQKVIGSIAKLGENSLSIYCLSVSLLSWALPIFYGKIVDIVGRNIMAENMLIFNFLFTPMLAVLYCFGLYFVVLLFKKCKIHEVIFGR